MKVVRWAKGLALLSLLAVSHASAADRGSDPLVDQVCAANSRFKDVKIAVAEGYETFDPAKLKILPAGSFYTEPANVPHYIEIEDDVVLQVSGMGPSGRRFVNPADNPK